MDDAARLIALEAIRQLKARYFEHLDRKEWAEWRALFLPDAVMDVRAEFPDAPDPSVHILTGADVILASVSRFVRNLETEHRGFSPMIEIMDADSATGLWGMEDRLTRRDGRVQGGRGQYHERYRRVGGRWYIEHIRVTRL